MLRQRTSRRVFLKGTGALVVSISFAGSLSALAEAAPLAAVDTNLKTDPTKLDSWLHVGGDGSITAFTSKVELGQGNQTALTQIVAEELDVPFGMVNLVMGDSARSAHEFATSASVTIQDAGSNLRQAAAEARKALLDLASKQLNVPAGSLQVSNGVVSKADGSGKVSYAELIGDKNFNVELKALTVPGGMLVPFTTAISGTATPKDPSKYTIVGTSVPRIDIPPKVTGQFTYMQDVKVPACCTGAWFGRRGSARSSSASAVSTRPWPVRRSSPKVISSALSRPTSGMPFALRPPSRWPGQSGMGCLT